MIRIAALESLLTIYPKKAVGEKSRLHYEHQIVRCKEE
jgi:hypothetical protein